MGDKEIPGGKKELRSLAKDWTRSLGHTRECAAGGGSAGIGSVDPKRMRPPIHGVKDHVYKGDLACIEGFGFTAQQTIQLGGLDGAI